MTFTSDIYCKHLNARFELKHNKVHLLSAYRPRTIALIRILHSSSVQHVIALNTRPPAPFNSRLLFPKGKLSRLRRGNHKNYTNMWPKCHWNASHALFSYALQLSKIYNAGDEAHELQTLIARWYWYCKELKCRRPNWTCLNMVQQCSPQEQRICQILEFGIK